MNDALPNALYVFAHPEPNSFNRQLFERGCAALSDRYTVVTSDLYAMGFDPLLHARDLGQRASDPGTFISRWAQATAARDLPSEVLSEQEKLRAADLIVFQFLLWWYALPAILKGWIDRVFTAGFGFDVVDPETGRSRKYGDGLLLGKRALVSVSLGETAQAVGPRGRSGDMDSLLFGLTHGTLFYTGISPLPLHVIAGADDLDSAGVESELERYERRLARVHEEEPIPYRPGRGGDYAPGQALRADIASGRVDLGIHRLDRGGPAAG